VRSRRGIVLADLLVLVLTITSTGCQAGSARSAADAAPVTGVTGVVARDLRFQPAAIQVPTGTAVTWRFDDGSVPHNVKGDGFASRNQTKGGFVHRFDRPGEYRYTCTLHAGMDGRVVVTG
jgi:plastocyanin